MPSVNIVREVAIEKTSRIMQLEALFDCPASERSTFTHHGNIPVETSDWNIGLLVGPSGTGKSSILNDVFGTPQTLTWGKGSVIDDFDSQLSMEAISQSCSAVGFNSIPSWMKPFSVLSTGEKFRVSLARTLIESTATPTTIDEFTSVVDRQVAKIASHAVQKFIRSHKRKLVVASCHYDIIDWLQPDWLYEPHSETFTRRLLCPRPPVICDIDKAPYSAWKIFSPYHYMSADLNRAARTYGLWANGDLATYCGILYRPHPRVRDIVGISRVVTLPDWQGLGLAMVLLDTLGAAYRSCGLRLHNYPAHPAFIRSHTKSMNWRLEKQGGAFSPRRGSTSTVGGFGGRSCAVFSYIGPALESKAEAERLVR